MAKVKHPLFSGDVQGQFGKQAIYTRGGVVRRYFRPRDPKSAAQLAVREAFKEMVMAGLTQEQADLLYAAIGHLHDDRYSQLGHLHDDRYSQLGHLHKQLILIGTALEDGVLGAGASNTAKPFRSGLGGSGWNVAIPQGGLLRGLYFRTAPSQPGTGSVTCTLNVNAVPQNVVAICPAGSGAGVWVDLENSYEINAGDVVWWDLKNNATSSSAPLISVVMRLEFDLLD